MGDGLIGDPVEKIGLVFISIASAEKLGAGRDGMRP